MVKTQIYLNEKEYEALRHTSYKEKVSVSSIVRRLVDKELLPHKKPRKKSAMEALSSLAGLAHETKKNVSEKHDDYLWSRAG